MVGKTLAFTIWGSDKNLSLVLCFYLIRAIFYYSSCTVSDSFYEGSGNIFQSPPVVQNQKIVAESLNCNFLDIALISQKDPLVSEFVQCLSTKKVSDLLQSYFISHVYMNLN